MNVDNTPRLWFILSDVYTKSRTFQGEAGDAQGAGKGHSQDS